MNGSPYPAARGASGTGSRVRREDAAKPVLVLDQPRFEGPDARVQHSALLDFRVAAGNEAAEQLEHIGEVAGARESQRGKGLARHVVIGDALAGDAAHGGGILLARLLVAGDGQHAAQVRRSAIEQRGHDAAEILHRDRGQGGVALRECEDVRSVLDAAWREEGQEVFVVERHVDVRGWQAEAARVILDDGLGLDVRDVELSVSQLGSARQRAEDEMLDAGCGGGINQVPALRNLAVEGLPVIGDAEDTVPALHRCPQAGWVFEISEDHFGACLSQGGGFLRLQSADEAANRITPAREQVRSDAASLRAGRAGNENGFPRHCEPPAWDYTAVEGRRGRARRPLAYARGSVLGLPHLDGDRLGRFAALVAFGHELQGRGAVGREGDALGGQGDQVVFDGRLDPNGARVFHSVADQNAFAAGRYLFRGVELGDLQLGVGGHELLVSGGLALGCGALVFLIGVVALQHDPAEIRQSNQKAGAAISQHLLHARSSTAAAFAASRTSAIHSRFASNRWTICIQAGAASATFSAPAASWSSARPATAAAIRLMAFEGRARTA